MQAGRLNTPSLLPGRSRFPPSGHVRRSKADDASHAESGASKNLHVILVVDDDAANLKLAQALLEAEGFAIRTATDAISALEVLKDCDPSLILMDIQLPGMDGWELTRRLKNNAATKHIPIIALTAYGVEGDANRARAIGFVDYVPKPVSTRELPRIVRRHLA